MRNRIAFQPGRLVAAALACLALAALSGCSDSPAAAAPSTANGRKVLCIGMDGLDYTLLKRLMDAGRMPNFSRVAAQGTFRSLATSMPPQSPVAWSNFIAGADPGVHQIYDFIHRDVNPPKPGDAVRLYLSTADTKKPEPGMISRWLPEQINWGDYIIPTAGAETVALRKGPSFWNALIDRGIPTTIYRMPANYPVAVEKKNGLLRSTGFQCLCGMGTPDISGGYGEFTLLTENVAEPIKHVAGGRIVQLNFIDNVTELSFEGPENPYRPAKDDEEPHFLAARLRVVRDSEIEAVTVELGAARVLLRKGEWSDWQQFELESGLPWGGLLGLAGVPVRIPTMVRLYVRSVHPITEIYVSPMQIDPSNAVNPVSEPVSFAADIAKQSGLFYTTGIPEDTKALRSSQQALTEDEFLSMVAVLGAERTRQYRDALARFRDGFLFYYFGHTDQLAHIFWRDTDPQHPGRIPEQDGKYDKVIENTYLEMDERVGEALKVLDDDDVLLIASDHGFSGFRRGFNVNTWLLQQKYMADNGSGARDNLDFVDWSQTRAYACGINSLFINLAGRERFGVVQPSEKRALMQELAAALVAVKDEDGSPVIAKVYIVEDVYPGADPQIAPDLLIGYAANYRGSWATATGGRRNRVLENNMDRWSGDHCIAAFLVPGILVTNRKVHVEDAALVDMAPTILGLFDARRPSQMRGRNLFDPASAGLKPPDRGAIKE